MIAIFTLVIFGALLIAYAWQRSDVLTGAYPWNYVQGSGVTASFIGASNTVMSCPNGMTTITVNKPAHNAKGSMFIVRNTDNSSAVTVTAATGVTLTGGTINATNSGFFVWSDETTIKRVA